MAKKAAKKLSVSAIAKLEADIADMMQPTRTLQFLNTGSSLVNIGLSGRHDGGWPLGGYNLIAGGSGSGKTFLVVSTLAEAANDPRFDDYDLIYDGPEGGALFDVAHLFGQKLASRLSVPRRGTSYTIEQFYANLRAHRECGRQFIWALDSMDSLSSEQEAKVNAQHDMALLTGEELDGSYGDGKARTNSQNIRTVMEHLVTTDSLLMIICQTRDSLSGSFSPKVYSGGNALRFYADCRMWTVDMGKNKCTVKGNEMTIGNIMGVKVDKNRARGRNFSVDVPIYYHTGIDDLGSLVAYLIETKLWKIEGGLIVSAPEFDAAGITPNELVKYIQSIEYDDELRYIAQQHWLTLEAIASSTVERKPRYE